MHNWSPVKHVRAKYTPDVYCATMSVAQFPIICRRYSSAFRSNPNTVCTWPLISKANSRAWLVPAIAVLFFPGPAYPIYLHYLSCVSCSDAPASDQHTRKSLVKNGAGCRGMLTPKLALEKVVLDSFLNCRASFTALVFLLCRTASTARVSSRCQLDSCDSAIHVVKDDDSGCLRMDLSIPISHFPNQNQNPNHQRNVQ